jgi:hypothetical protein
MPDPAAATSRGPDGPGSSGPGHPSEAFSRAAMPARIVPTSSASNVTDRLPFVGRLVRDQLGQASLEVTLDLAHELLSLVGELDDGDPAISLGAAAVSEPPDFDARRPA